MGALRDAMKKMLIREMPIARLKELGLHEIFPDGCTYQEALNYRMAPMGMKLNYKKPEPPFE